MCSCIAAKLEYGIPLGGGEDTIFWKNAGTADPSSKEELPEVTEIEGTMLAPPKEEQ